MHLAGLPMAVGSLLGRFRPDRAMSVSGPRDWGGYINIPWPQNIFVHCIRLQQYLLGDGDLGRWGERDVVCRAHSSIVSPRSKKLSYQLTTSVLILFFIIS